MVNAIVDTQALLWLFDDDAQLGSKSRELVNSASRLLVSDASLWEVSIKVSIGKLEPIDELASTVQNFGFTRLGLTDRYLKALESLPLHHRDPFDRMIISQALSDGLPVLTADRAFAQYGVQVIDARE